MTRLSATVTLVPETEMPWQLDVSRALTVSADTVPPIMDERKMPQPPDSLSGRTSRLPVTTSPELPLE
jgi:hypothetical protein